MPDHPTSPAHASGHVDDDRDVIASRPSGASTEPPGDKQIEDFARAIRGSCEIASSHYVYPRHAASVLKAAQEHGIRLVRAGAASTEATPPDEWPRPKPTCGPDATNADNCGHDHGGYLICQAVAGTSWGGGAPEPDYCEHIDRDLARWLDRWYGDPTAGWASTEATQRPDLPLPAIQRAVAWVEENITPRRCDNEGVSDCWRCTTVALARWLSRAALTGATSPEPSRESDLRAALEWALDLIDMYDRELLRRGDPPEVVESPVHLAGKAKARAALARTAAPGKPPVSAAGDDGAGPGSVAPEDVRETSSGSGDPARP